MDGVERWQGKVKLGSPSVRVVLGNDRSTGAYTIELSNGVHGKNIKELGIIVDHGIHIFGENGSRFKVDHITVGEATDGLFLIKGIYRIIVIGKFKGGRVSSKYMCGVTH